MAKEYFTKLNAINVNEHTEDKEGLKYLSWCWAWAEVLKIYPDATYYVERFGENKTPYVFDPNLGYMVFTHITLDGIEKEMWLPVMDSKNKAMKDKQYTYTTKYGEKTVEPATMFDINKTIMRCLVKNLAMFGLGMYIYNGEELPEEESKLDFKEELMKFIEENKLDKVEVCKTYNLNAKSTNAQFADALNQLKAGK